MCAVRWHVIPIPRPTGVKCLVACLYSHLRRRRAFILIAQPVAQFFRKGFGYAALQEHTASFSANRATHVTSVILRNPRTPLFSGASAPHTHTLTHSRTRTLYTDNQHFAIWSTSLKAGIFSVVLTEGLNCREVCNGNLCCVIAWEEKIAKQRLFSPSLYTSLCLLFFFFFLCKKKSIFIIVFDVYVVLILSRLYFPPFFPPSSSLMCVQFVVSPVAGGPCFFRMFTFFLRFLKMSVNMRVWRSFFKSKYIMHTYTCYGVVCRRSAAFSCQHSGISTHADAYYTVIGGTQRSH